MAFIQKNMVYGNFYENLRKIFLIHLVSHFLNNQGKSECKNEVEKMSLIFEFSISKLGYMEIFMKI